MVRIAHIARIERVARGGREEGAACMIAHRTVHGINCFCYFAVFAIFRNEN